MCATLFHPVVHVLFTHMNTHTCSSVSYKKGCEFALLLAHMFTICHHCDGLNTTAGCWLLESVLPDWKCPSIVPEAQNYHIWKKIIMHESNVHNKATRPANDHNR